MSTRSRVAALCSLAAVRVGAQTSPRAASVNCDSVVLAARVDSVLTGVFISAGRVGTEALDSTQVELITNYVGAAFVPPRPFRLTVFAGPPRTRLLRPLVDDSVTVLRAPTVTGVYRFTSAAKESPTNVHTVRASLMPGFDLAAMSAIRDAPKMPVAFTPPDQGDSMTVEIRISTDSTAGARRMFSAFFPRMPVKDAVARRDNSAAAFPNDAMRDSISAGEVVLRFVVGRDGAPVPETLEIVRANLLSFVRSALATLPSQAFAPATIHGCAVAQLIDYPFIFDLPVAHRRPVRH